ncbi:MAG: hypothetical protein LT103_10240 [Burkholderiaceae bacterium]|nr:hypothetical protein [Burkholderiaceae bacterium]
MDTGNETLRSEPSSEVAARRHRMMRFVPLIVPLMGVMVAACAAVILAQV